MVPQCSGLLERNRSAANGASHVQSGEASGSSANGATQSSMVSSLTFGVTSAIGIRHGCSSASAYVLRYPYTPVPADGIATPTISTNAAALDASRIDCATMSVSGPAAIQYSGASSTRIGEK